MFTCQHVERLVARYMVGNLPPWSRIAVVRHLDKCPPCRDLLQSHHRVAILMDVVTPGDPPEGLWNRVLNEIADEAPGHERVSVPASWDWKPSLAVATAGLAVGVMLGNMFVHTSNPVSPMSAAMPSASPSMAAFVEHHGRMATQDPLMDPVAQGAYIMTSFRETEHMQGGAR